MKAAVSNYDKENNQYVVIQNVSVPVPRENEVLVEVYATSLNFADLLAVKGAYHQQSREPFIPGFDCAGYVVDKGSKVKHFKIGDRVAGFPSGGAFSEYVCVHEDLLYPMENNLDFDAAAASISVGITAYELLYKVAGLRKDETAVIHAAAGGVGLTLLQLAKHIGAKVIGVVGSETKAKFIRQYGADYVIQHTEVDFKEKVLQITNDKGADIVFDSIGGHTFEKSFACLAPYGKLITFGHASGKSGTVRSYDLHTTSKAVLGYSSGQRQKDCPHALKTSAICFFRLVANEEIKIPISHHFKLSDINEAFKRMESRNVIGKMVIFNS
ncbi:quinone oxidoreductase family protein [Oceanobacillus timonensis]|uniref:quinone oxidoreductase family protein n=1 Tax=Oceanobacillus timonensis TaxID=1926285 RepID=UPI0009BA8F77|nr:NADPH:quinone oxidoreductase family protein [Oceanobacillus timonensis]